MCYVREVSNLSPISPPHSATPATSIARARKRRAKRGIVANYIHEISPRHRAATTPVTAAAVAPVLPAVALAPPSEPLA